MPHSGSIHPHSTDWGSSWSGRTPGHGSGMATPGHIPPISRGCVLGPMEYVPKGNYSHEQRQIPVCKELTF